MKSDKRSKRRASTRRTRSVWGNKREQEKLRGQSEREERANLCPERKRRAAGALVALAVLAALALAGSALLGLLCLCNTARDTLRLSRRRQTEVLGACPLGETVCESEPVSVNVGGGVRTRRGERTHEVG